MFSWLRNHFALALAGVLALVTFSVYARTLAPGVAAIFDDSLELQLVAFQPGIAHPTGYPLYTLLGKLFTFLPVGDVAYRVNLFSAVAAGLAVGAWYLAIQEALAYGSPAPLPARHLPAMIGALALAFTTTFWSQATISAVLRIVVAEVTLAISSRVALPEAPRGPTVQMPEILS